MMLPIDRKAASCALSWAVYVRRIPELSTIPAKIMTKMQTLGQMHNQSCGSRLAQYKLCYTDFVTEILLKLWH